MLTILTDQLRCLPPSMRTLRASIESCRQPKQAEEIFHDLAESNDYGVRDGLFDEAANILTKFLPDW